MDARKEKKAKDRGVEGGGGRREPTNIEGLRENASKRMVSIEGEGGMKMRESWKGRKRVRKSEERGLEID